jgi:hypothetical protein
MQRAILRQHELSATKSIGAQQIYSQRAHNPCHDVRGKIKNKKKKERQKEKVGG